MRSPIPRAFRNPILVSLTCCCCISFLVPRRLLPTRAYIWAFHALCVMCHDGPVATVELDVTMWIWVETAMAATAMATERIAATGRPLGRRDVERMFLGVLERWEGRI